MCFFIRREAALFIDRRQPVRAAKGLQFDIDYKRLLERCRKGTLVRAFYYTAVAGRSGILGPCGRWWTGWTTRFRW